MCNRGADLNGQLSLQNAFSYEYDSSNVTTQAFRTDGPMSQHILAQDMSFIM